MTLGEEEEEKKWILLTWDSNPDNDARIGLSGDSDYTRGSRM